MAVSIGPFDPLRIQFNLLNALLSKGVLTYDEARSILKNSLNPELPEAEQEQILNSLFKRPGNG